MHAAAIRAQAEAELCALRGWPQPARCRSGVHVGGPGCHEHPDAQPPTDVAALPRYRVGIHAIPLEVWAAQR